MPPAGQWIYRYTAGSALCHRFYEVWRGEGALDVCEVGKREGGGDLVVCVEKMFFFNVCIYFFLKLFPK